MVHDYLDGNYLDVEQIALTTRFTVRWAMHGPCILVSSKPGEPS
jgi:hypothetical protein